MHADQQVGPNYHLAMPDFTDTRRRNCKRARQLCIVFSVEVFGDRSQQRVWIVGNELGKDGLLHDFLLVLSAERTMPPAGILTQVVFIDNKLHKMNYLATNIVFVDGGMYLDPIMLQRCVSCGPTKGQSVSCKLIKGRD